MQPENQLIQTDQKIKQHARAFADISCYSILCVTHLSKQIEGHLENTQAGKGEEVVGS